MYYLQNYRNMGVNIINKDFLDFSKWRSFTKQLQITSLYVKNNVILGVIIITYFNHRGFYAYIPDICGGDICEHSVHYATKIIQY
jgi:hypothetical protein